MLHDLVHCFQGVTEGDLRGLLFLSGVMSMFSLMCRVVWLALLYFPRCVCFFVSQLAVVLFFISPRLRLIRVVR